MTLVEFLWARLDDDYRWALMAAGPIGDHWQSDGGQVFAEHPTDAIVDYAGQSADHIARHDPARVLAEVEAKRRIIELAEEASGLDSQVDGEFRVGSRNLEAEPYVGDLILRQLALPYAGHADYREEWRP